MEFYCYLNGVEAWKGVFDVDGWYDWEVSAGIIEHVPFGVVCGR